MRSRTLTFLGVLCLLSVTSAFGQDVQPGMAVGFPAASVSDMNCSGFISGQPVSNDISIFNGADDDQLSYTRAWMTGEHVFLRSRTGANIAVGTEYSLVRSASELMRVRWYDGQGASIRSLGKPYENAGRVKVVRVTPDGAIAEVTAACGLVMRGDLAIPAVNRPIPAFDPAAQFDHYAPSNGKLLGAITAGVDNASYFGGGAKAFINLGTSDGVSPGQKFRIFHILNDEPAGAYMLPPTGPRQTIGELIVLSSEEKSSLVMVTKSIREIKLGDGIEQE
ncbi:MAG: hypothetical protein HY508_00130 [Acidobacteria bacterium]|nr:hypothetical protein [Acidobacteriota bacterium]